MYSHQIEIMNEYVSEMCSPSWIYIDGLVQGCYLQRICTRDTAVLHKDIAPNHSYDTFVFAEHLLLNFNIYIYMYYYNFVLIHMKIPQISILQLKKFNGKKVEHIISMA